MVDEKVCEASFWMREISLKGVERSTDSVEINVGDERNEKNAPRIVRGECNDGKKRQRRKYDTLSDDVFQPMAKKKKRDNVGLLKWLQQGGSLNDGMTGKQNPHAMGVENDVGCFVGNGKTRVNTIELKTRNSPTILVDAIKQMNPDQKASICEMRFGGILELLTMAPSLYVSCYFGCLESCYNEKYRSTQSPYRFFSSTDPCCYTIVDPPRGWSEGRRRDMFCEKLNEELSIIEGMQIKKLDMFVFLIYQSEHYYLMAFNLKRCTAEIINNSVIVDSESADAKYRVVPELLNQCLLPSLRAMKLLQNQLVLGWLL